MSAAGATTIRAAHGSDALTTDAPGTLARLRAFHTLDALRGVAALVILFFHAGFFFDIPAPAEGYLAVDLFFAMSGFVIAYRYEADLARGLRLGAFIALRLRRLYPLFLLGTVLGLVPALAAIAGAHADPVHRGMVAAFPLAVLMLPSHAIDFARPDVYPLNFVSWSLALELVANVAWAATYRIWTLRNLLCLLAVAAAGLCLTAAAHGSLNAGYYWSNAWGGVPRIVFGFGMGVLLFRLRGARIPLPRVPWWACVALVPALLFADPGWLGAPWARPVYDLVAVMLVLPVLVRLAIDSDPPPAARGFCALAGVYSYVVYSLHIGFVGLFLRIEDRLHIDRSIAPPSHVLAFAAGLAALCWLAHVGYDKPVRRRLALGHAPRRRAVPLGPADK